MEMILLLEIIDNDYDKNKDWKKHVTLEKPWKELGFENESAIEIY